MLLTENTMGSCDNVFVVDKWSSTFVAHILPRPQIVNVRSSKDPLSHQQSHLINMKLACG